MKIRKMLAGLVLLCFTGAALADLELWEDYDLGEGVTNVTTVKVDSNMVEKYLEGLSKTWAPAQKIRKELGHIEGYWIHVSQLEDAGDFNVVLGIDYKNAAAMEPNKARYDAFTKKWGEENQKQSDEIVMTYPEIREIVGEYMMRSVTFK